MEKWLRDVTAYLRPNLPTAFEPAPAPTADDAAASLLNPKLSFCDRDQRQNSAWDLPADVEGPLSDLIPRGHQQIGPSVAQGGIEVLAWYRPFHAFGDRWGIYLRVDGIAHLAFEILAAHTPSAFPRRFAVRAAMEALLRHEESHFEAEVYATGQELALGRPIYLPYSRHFASTGAFRREESLANRRMVHHHWDHPPLGGGPTREAIQALADSGPRSYSRWRDYGVAKQFAPRRTRWPPRSPRRGTLAWRLTRPGQSCCLRLGHCSPVTPSTRVVSCQPRCGIAARFPFTFWMSRPVRCGRIS